MTPNNLLFCEHCRSYTKHTFVVNVGVCNICIKENKPERKFTFLNFFKTLWDRVALGPDN